MTSVSSERNGVFQWTILLTLILASLGGIGYLIFVSLPAKVDTPHVTEQQLNAFYEAQELLEQEVPSRQELERADTLLTGLLKDAPDVAELYYYLALKNFEFYFRYADAEEKRRVLQVIKQQLTSALGLDPQHAASLSTLAYMEFYVEKDFHAAMELYRRALTVAPSDFQTHLHFAQLMLLLGDYNAAEKHARSAIVMGADESISALGVWIFTLIGDFRSAELELSRLYNYDPMSLLYHSAAIQLYEAKGDEERAVNAYLKSFERLDYRLDDLDEAKRRFTLDGLAGIALWLAEEKKEERDVGHGTGAIALARYYATARKANETMNYLEMIEREKPNALLWIHVDPKFAFLADNPQFQELTKRLGLPEVISPWSGRMASVLQ